MLLFNIILVLALLAFIGSGLKDGLISAIGRILGAVIGFLVAKGLYLQLAAWMSPVASGSWGKIIAFALLFIVTVRVMGLIFKALDKTYDFLAFIPFMKSTNHVLGGALGFLEGMLVIGGLIWLIKTFLLFPTLVTYCNHSAIAVWVYNGFTKVLGILI